jgi:hypothetical protein
VAVDVAWKTPQFWLLWVVLCMNVSAGIGVLGRAADMCQDMFGVSAAIGAGFTGLLSIFNMGGRFVWSSVSDFTGRKTVYSLYFVLGAVRATDAESDVVRDMYGVDYQYVRGWVCDDSGVFAGFVWDVSGGGDSRTVDYGVEHGGGDWAGVD